MIGHSGDLKTSGQNNNAKQQCRIFGGRPRAGVVGRLMMMPSNREIYEAFLTRTDLPGAIIGVKTTGVFCRPGCPARAPKFENCAFYDGPEAALRAGYRACKRCHPAGEDHALMRAVIALVEENEAGRIDDAALKAAGIDPSTARRKFTQRLGMSVADYARLRRLGLAAKAMAGGASVIEAQLDAGFESASGFRAAFTKTFGAAPAKTKAKPLFVDWLETPEGRMVVVTDERALYLIEFVDRVKLPRQFERLRRVHGRAIVPGTTGVTDQIRREIADYFAGTRQAFSVVIETTGTAFQGGVWAALQSIPYGETWSYGALAAAIGNDKAVRAVASANGANGLAIVIPCHRVIGSDGGLGGYAGGVDRKARLLTLERAHTGAAPKAP
jgi:AraC family transcriptional regulator of adaptative response/methylated-DNA-[protein]-cysteine methyltransferase